MSDQPAVKVSDYPFMDTVTKAREHVIAGRSVHQKFTCEKCYSRQTMEKANVFYETGKCEECSHITNIKERGCNFMLVIGPPL